MTTLSQVVMEDYHDISVKTYTIKPLTEYYKQSQWILILYGKCTFSMFFFAVPDIDWKCIFVISQRIFTHWV